MKKSMKKNNKSKKQLKNKPLSISNRSLLVRRKKSFKPRMYRMKVKISQRKFNKNNNTQPKLGNLENGVSFNTIGSYVNNKAKQ